MKSTDIPIKFPIAFGSNAAAGTIRPVPTADQTATSPGAASLTTGFPVATGQPLASGGVPPAMQDFNGLFNQITAWNRWQNAGAMVSYDSTFATAVGGYPSGAILQSTTPGKIWLCIADNNTTNPDAAGSTNWLAFGPNAGGYVPIFVARTYYVNGASGSDANDGLSASGALQTINAAIAKVGALNLNGNTVTIQVADGTYGPFSATSPFFGNGTVVIQGNLTTPANVKIQTNTGDAIAASNGAVFSIQGFQPLTQASGNGCVIAQFAGQINMIGAMDFPACAAAYHIAGLDGGQVRIGANYTISGAGGASHYSASNYGRVFKYLGVSLAVSVLNPLTFTVAFASIAAGELYIPNLTFSGSGTNCSRYSIVDNGIIRTLSGNATYIPGNANGTTANGGVYS